MIKHLELLSAPPMEVPWQLLQGLLAHTASSHQIFCSAVAVAPKALQMATVAGHTTTSEGLVGVLAARCVCPLRYSLVSALPHALLSALADLQLCMCACACHCESDAMPHWGCSRSLLTRACLQARALPVHAASIAYLAALLAPQVRTNFVQYGMHCQA